MGPLSSRSLVAAAIEAMEKSTGAQRGYRRAHARGIVCRGSFVAAPRARELSIAEHLQGDTIDAHVRLSNAAGNPLASDHDARVLGLGVRFHLPSGKIVSWASANLPSFVARTPDDFVRITTALRPVLFGLPNPFKVLWYVLTRPSSFAALKAAATMPSASTFAHVRFNGIHTYDLVAPNGARQPFRYWWEPVSAPTALSPAQSRALPPQYLLNELTSRLAHASVQYRLVFQFPEPGDPLDDATRAWPATRRTAIAGTLTIDRVEEDQRALEPLVFDPTGVVPGIELSSDPLLAFRAAVYSESHRLRTHETRDVAAPPDMAQ